MADDQFRVVDRRQFSDVDSVPVDGAREEHPRYPSYVEELRARYDQKCREVDEEIARARARLEADSKRRLELVRRDLILPFLDVLDNLERTLASGRQDLTPSILLDGVEMTANLFRGRLKAQGITPIPVLGEVFDPNSMEAIGVEEVADPDQDGIVVEEAVTGYRMGDTLLRPARVRVARAS